MDDDEGVAGAAVNGMRPVVVWGNCQAEPVAALLTEPLSRHGLRVVVVPPVFLVDQAGLSRVHDLVSRAAVLVTQPVRDEYSIPPCGAAPLTTLLPPTGGRAVVAGFNGPRRDAGPVAEAWSAATGRPRSSRTSR